MKTKCTFKGCGRLVLAKELCGAHYQQKHRRGKSLRKIQKQYHGLTELDRFEKRVIKGSGCWTWRGRADGFGRGQFRAAGGIMERTHRAAWRLYVGTPIGTWLVCHTCDNPNCVKPSHLYLGSRKNNTGDMIARGRMSRGTLHPGAKLTEDAVLDIRTSVAGPTALAAKYGVSRAAIIAARKGKTWRHVTTQSEDQPMTQHIPCVLYHADHEPKTYNTDGEVEAAKKAGWQDHPVDKNRPASREVHIPPTEEKKPYQPYNKGGIR